MKGTHTEQLKDCVKRKKIVKINIKCETKHVNLTFSIVVKYNCVCVVTNNKS
jgi:hypothetical protein